MKRNYQWSAVLVAPWLLAATLPAAAVTTYQWDTKGCATVNSVSCTDTTSTPSGGPGVTFSAISDTGGSTLGTKLLHEAYVVNYDTTNGHLGVTSEAGVNSAANGTAPLYTNGNAPGAEETKVSPQHAMDNNGNSEFILLNFGGTAVQLSQVTLGWSQTDSDLTVLAYTGGGNPGLTTTGATTYAGATGLVAKGWTVIGNYSNVCPVGCSNGSGQPASASATISTAVSSSYWLIGAYNNAFGGSLTTGDDYVKLLSVAGCSGAAGCSTGGQRVPEPSSLLLAGIALFGLTALRRRGII